MTKAKVPTREYIDAKAAEEKAEWQRVVDKLMRSPQLRSVAIVTNSRIRAQEIIMPLMQKMLPSDTIQNRLMQTFHVLQGAPDETMRIYMLSVSDAKSLDNLMGLRFDAIYFDSVWKPKDLNQSQVLNAIGRDAWVM